MTEPSASRKAVVLLSGGLDSTTTLAIAMSQGFEPCAMTFRYGQRHQAEIESARRVAAHFGVAEHVIVDIDLRTFGGSALTSELDVPKSRSNEEMGAGIPVTYVPARNTIFLSFALGWAEVLKAGDIFIGVNAVDYSGYPDCRVEYIEAFMWEPFHVQAVKDLRAGGIHHTLMVDAPNWGQDWTATMLEGDGAPNIINADPDKNVVFSVHMYDVYWDSMIVDDYFNVFTMKGVPLVVGEFAADHGPDKDVAEDAIINRAEELGLGYLGWSWSGNNAELSSLDMTVNFNVGSLTPWGERLLNGQNGIGQTGKPCSCFE